MLLEKLIALIYEKKIIITKNNFLIVLLFTLQNKNMSFWVSELPISKKLIKETFANKGVLKYIFEMKDLFESIMVSDSKKIILMIEWFQKKVKNIIFKLNEVHIKSKEFPSQMKQANEKLEQLSQTEADELEEYWLYLLGGDNNSSIVKFLDSYFTPLSWNILENIIICIDFYSESWYDDYKDYKDKKTYEMIKKIIKKVLLMREEKKKK